jgi:hypothetical protein
MIVGFFGKNRYLLSLLCCLEGETFGAASSMLGESHTWNHSGNGQKLGAQCRGPIGSRSREFGNAKLAPRVTQCQLRNSVKTEGKVGVVVAPLHAHQASKEDNVTGRHKRSILHDRSALQLVNLPVGRPRWRGSGLRSRAYSVADLQAPWPVTRRLESQWDRRRSLLMVQHRQSDGTLPSLFKKSCSGFSVHMVVVGGP